MNSQALRRMAVYYVLFMISTILACCSFEKFAEYASWGKPYSVLFTRYISRGLGNENTTRVIFFGDSALFFPPSYKMTVGDPQIHLPGLLQSKLSADAPELNAGVAEWAFLSARMFHYYCMFYKAIEFSPKLIIIPINWTTFGEGYKDLQKDEFFELSALVPLFKNRSLADDDDGLKIKGISFLDHLRYKAQIHSFYLLGFKEWVMKRKSRVSIPSLLELVRAVDQGTLEIRRSDREFLSDYYPLVISRTDEGYRLICSVASLASSNRTKILFYISPMNEEYLQKVGYMNTEAFEASKRIIMEATRRKGVYCVDFSNMLGDRAFFDSYEHYSIQGRKQLADRLAPIVIKILNEDNQ